MRGWRGHGKTGQTDAGHLLTEAERETLERWARRPKSAQALGPEVPYRARGRRWAHKRGDRGRACAWHRATVGKWRRRFAEMRLDGLMDEPRPGRPRTITDADVERVIVKTLEERPVDATHWSTRSLAQATGMSQTAVCRIWRAFGLKPHLTESFKLSADPQFIDKVQRHRGALPQPARCGHRALRGREVPDPGPRPHRSHPAPSSRRARAAHPRLPPLRRPPTSMPPLILLPGR